MMLPATNRGHGKDMLKGDSPMRFFIALVLLALIPVTAHPEEKGKTLYDQSCASCHGEKGDGKGPAADFVFPKPRDFTKGTYKFKSTGSGEPALDSDILRTIREGNPGTSMPAWKRFSDDEAKALVAYLKQFSLDNLYKERTLSLGYGEWLTSDIALGGALKQLYHSFGAPNMVVDDNGNVQSGNPSFFAQNGNSNTAYLIFMVIGIVGYFTVPSIAGYIVNVGGHALFNRTSALASMAMSYVGGTFMQNILKQSPGTTEKPGGGQEPLRGKLSGKPGS